MQVKRDNVKPSGTWKFDKEVADCFEDMLRRSIPDYPVMRELIYRFGSRTLTGKREPVVVDIGCSNGLAVQRFAESFPDARFILRDVSEDMVRAARERYPDESRFDIACANVADAYPLGMADLCLMVLTLQFTPVEERQAILRKAYRRMKRGGALILVEKVLGDGQKAEEELTAIYYDLKREHEYTQEQIDAKRLSLRHVMEPLKAEWDVEILKKAGFSDVFQFWQCLNFCGWIAYKD